MLTLDGKEYDIQKMVQQADPKQLEELANLMKRLVPILKNEEGKKMLAKKLAVLHAPEIEAMRERLSIVEQGIKDKPQTEEDEFPSIP